MGGLMEIRSGSRLPIARYRVSVRMQSALALSDYAGSILRGSFGAALRRLCCTEGAIPCGRCRRSHDCAFPAIFESPAPAETLAAGFAKVPNPYVIEAPPFDAPDVPAGACLVFHMVLVGQALERLPLIVRAWQSAFQRGIGVCRSVGHLQSLDWLPHDAAAVRVWEVDSGGIRQHHSVLQIPFWPTVRQAELIVRTPMRLSRRGAVSSAAGVTPVALIAAIIRRTSLLLRLHAGADSRFDGGALLADAGLLSHEHRLRWRAWARYSARQQREMPLGGLIGSWTLGGNLDSLLPWLWLAQYIHVGKNTTFGLGHVDLILGTRDV
jgi:hypothetical protein